MSYAQSNRDIFECERTTGGLRTAFGADTYVDKIGAGVTAYAGAIQYTNRQVNSMGCKIDSHCECVYPR